MLFGTGMLLGFIGAGGGGVLIGILSGIFGLDIDKAIGTALAAMCVVTMFGAISHYREGHVAARIGLIVGLTGIFGAALGAELGQRVPDRVLELGAGLTLWFLAVLVWLRTAWWRAGDVARNRPRTPGTTRRRSGARRRAGRYGRNRGWFLRRGDGALFAIGVAHVAEAVAGADHWHDHVDAGLHQRFGSHGAGATRGCFARTPDRGYLRTLHGFLYRGEIHRARAVSRLAHDGGCGANRRRSNGALL